MKLISQNRKNKDLQPIVQTKETALTHWPLEWLISNLSLQYHLESHIKVTRKKETITK